MKKVLVAGATGYLGSYVVKEFALQGFSVRALARNIAKLEILGEYIDEKFIAEITDPASLSKICNDIDIVFSSIGITRQKDSLTYMDVDYQGNMNLLNEALKAGVQKFIYVSVLNGERLTGLDGCYAKEKFVEELKKSGLDYCIIRPNGFFSDMTEFYRMAERGRVYLLGNGNYKTNPIHGEDLAKVCVSVLEINEKEIDAGGPETLTHNKIAELAFNTVQKKVKVVHIPDWIRRSTLKVGKLFMSSKSFGPVEFFMNVMAMDMVAPKYGKHSLKSYFNELRKK